MILLRTAIVILLLVNSSAWSYVIDLEGDEDRARNESKVFYELYTRKNPTEPQILWLDDLAALRQSNFDPELTTKFFAHGWNADASSATSTKNAYLGTVDCNFISIDWSVLSTGVDYPLIILRNAPVAANHTAAFIDFLIKNTNTSVKSLHLIGFSAGAHVAAGAAAGMTSGRVPRVTGLDPAGPFLSLNETGNRLDPSDADFVDVIHTNGGDLLSNELSFFEPIGHIDFYPNGGQFQPGCFAESTAGQGRGGCDHSRAVAYFAESINNTVGFRAVECANQTDFEAGLCKNNPVQYMGEATPPTARGVYYLATNAAKPYAMG